MQCRRVFILFFSVVLAACGGDSEPPADGVGSGPDRIFLNARIYTDGSSGSLVEALAVTGEKVSAVGTRERIAAMAGPNTEIVDLENRAVLPGLIDGHAHPWQGGEKHLYQCNFAFSTTPEALAEIIEACASSPEAPEWIVGGQWNSNFFVDNNIASPREFLDAVSHGHPVFLDDDSAHHGWANTRALELAGVALSADTVDPDGGRFVRDRNGVPNGVLLESASGVVSAVIPPHTPEQKVAAIAAASGIANSFGVTAFGEARTPESALKAYQTADQRGQLTVHALLYQQSYSLIGDQAPLEPVSAYEARVAQYDSPNTFPRAIKFFLDGVPTASRSAMMLSPYTTDAKYPDVTSGMQMIPSDELFSVVAAFDRAGYIIKIHTAGDGAVKLALDAVENARQQNGNHSLQISLAHAGFVAESDIARFKALNVASDYSPYLWYPRPIIDSVVQAVGLPRGAKYWPTRDLLNAGANVFGGSDWPSAAADMNPWPAIEALVTRKNPFLEGDATLWVEQAVSLDEAIGLWTTRPAEAMGLSAITGDLTVGKFADFVVLDRDLHQISITEVSEILPEQTWWRGKQVFSSL